jgi:hypothetical protein
MVRQHISHRLEDIVSSACLLTIEKASTEQEAASLSPQLPPLLAVAWVGISVFLLFAR